MTHDTVHENPKKFWDDLPTYLNVLEQKRGWHVTEGVYKSIVINDTYGMPKSYEDAFNYYNDKFDIYDAQIFTSLGHCEGFGMHEDPDSLLLVGLYGNTTYAIKENNNDIVLKPGETLYVPKGGLHWGKGSYHPRIIYSLGTHREIKKEDVTYHYDYL